jgi:hypothetical protein
METNEPSFRELIKESLSAVGSNPGRVRLNPVRWTIMYPSPVIKLLLGLLITLFLTIKIHWLFVIVFIAFLFANFIYWFNAFLRFKVGDVNPGKVVHLNPDRIAVATNMTKGIGNFPIIRILDIKLRSEDRILNKIIPTIASYANNPYGYPFWSEFKPVPINHGITRKGLIESYSNTYGEEEINMLNDYLSKVATIEPETYKIDEESTDWINFKKVEIGDLRRMKGPEALNKE